MTTASITYIIIIKPIWRLNVLLSSFNDNPGLLTVDTNLLRTYRTNIYQPFDVSYILLQVIHDYYDGLIIAISKMFLDFEVGNIFIELRRSEQYTNIITLRYNLNLQLIINYRNRKNDYERIFGGI